MKSLSWKFFRTQVGLTLVSLLPIAVNGQTTFRLFTNLDATIYIEFCYGPSKLPAT